jgi:hypothetical protein
LWFAFDLFGFLILPGPGMILFPNS